MPSKLETNTEGENQSQNKVQACHMTRVIQAERSHISLHSKIHFAVHYKLSFYLPFLFLFFFFPKERDLNFPFLYNLETSVSRISTGSKALQDDISGGHSSRNQKVREMKIENCTGNKMICVNLLNSRLSKDNKKKLY